MPEFEALAQPLCASADLVERGRAFVFDVLLWGRPARAFVLRFDGRLVGYINRCGHVPVEMDWQPGEFLDQDKRWIICAIHGARCDALASLTIESSLVAARLDMMEP